MGCYSLGKQVYLCPIKETPDVLYHAGVKILLTGACPETSLFSLGRFIVPRLARQGAVQARSFWATQSRLIDLVPHDD